MPSKQSPPTGPATMPRIARRGLLFVLSSPSGAGKTTLARRLLDADPMISMSVSVTTRAPRPGEMDGRDYLFLDEAGFAQMKDAGELLEWARVFGNHYGTPRAPVEAAINAGRMEDPQAGRLLRFYEEALMGYTYLEDPNAD